MSTVIRTVVKPSKKEKVLTIAPDRPRRIARHAPTLAPEETPSRSGETSLL